MGFITLMCPNCNQSLEMDDSREFGFCQYCGTKVMQDKVVVQHTGSVKIDNKEVVEKFLANAHRALLKEDWEEVEKYYNLVEQNVPDNMEAVFFSSYGKAMLSLSESDFFKREQKFGVLNRSMSVLSDYYETTTENKEEVLRKINNYIKKMYSVTFVYQRQSVDVVGAIRAASGVTGSKQWCINLLNSTKKAFYTELKQISEKHNDEFIKELLLENSLDSNSIQSSQKNNNSAQSNNQQMIDSLQKISEKFTSDSTLKKLKICKIVSLVFAVIGIILLGLWFISQEEELIYGCLGSLGVSLYIFIITTCFQIGIKKMKK